MDSDFLLRGIIIGFSIAAPVGPIGVLCIRRTLASGFVAGLASGLGAASADAIYGSIAALGLTVVTSLLVSHQDWLRVVGGAFLCYLGVRTLLARPAGQLPSAQNVSLASAYASTFLLTLTNPMTILSFVAIFSGLGIASAGGDYASAGLLVLGVFTGLATWWLLLSAGTSHLRSRLSQGALQWVNRASGTVIAGFGLLALVSLMG